MTKPSHAAYNHDDPAVPPGISAHQEKFPGTARHLLYASPRILFSRKQSKIHRFLKPHLASPCYRSSLSFCSSLRSLRRTRRRRAAMMTPEAEALGSRCPEIRGAPPRTRAPPVFSCWLTRSRPDAFLRTPGRRSSPGDPLSWPPACRLPWREETAIV